MAGGGVQRGRRRMLGVVGERGREKGQDGGERLGIAGGGGSYMWLEVEAILGQVWAILVHHECIMGHLGDVWEPSWAILRHLLRHLLRHPENNMASSSSP